MGDPLLFYDIAIGNFATMKRILYFGVVLSATLVCSCGSDRQIEQRNDSDAQRQESSQPANPAAGGTLDILLQNGARYDQPFDPGDGKPAMAILFIESNTAMDSSLRADGFDGPLDKLAIVSSTDSASDQSLLIIDKDGIFDGRGNRLIDQIPALHGYAWRVGVGAIESVLGRRSFVSVILLDENGAESSDELYIYWKSGEASSGSFIVTNIPNEIL